MSRLPLTLPIPVGVPGIEFMLWIRQFEVETLAKRYKVGYPHATLYMQKVVDYNTRKSMNQASQRALSFAITQDNLESLQCFFYNALQWFGDKSIREKLYVVNDEGTTVFNSEYSSIHEIVKSEFANSVMVLKAVPTVVEVGKNVNIPGLVLYINLKEHHILLDEIQFSKLCSFIVNFNFISYSIFAFECFKFSALTNSVLSQEEVEKRLNSRRRYDSNFRY